MKHFDILPPKVSKKAKQERAWRRFMALALGALALVGALQLYSRGLEWYASAVPLGNAAYAELRGGMEALKEKRFDEAEASFRKADQHLASLQELLKPFTLQSEGILQKGPFGGAIERLLSAGREVSQAGQLTSSTLRGMTPENFEASRAAAGELFSHVLRMQNDLNRINTFFLPSRLREPVRAVRAASAQLLPTVIDLQKDLDVAAILLGDATPHRFLILLQNSAERRATGGFIGSYVIADMNDGTMTRFEAKDVYESDGRMTEKVPAPPGIDRVAPYWYLRDANTSPDFPTSAEKIRWFLEKSRGPSVETVIAIDQTVAEALLKVTGPVTVSGLPKITAQNFAAVFSFLAETKQGGKSSPKEVLFRFIEALRPVVLKPSVLAALPPVLLDRIEKGHIQMHSSDPAVQAFAKRWGLDGKMPEPRRREDFLALISTSVGGNKSDAYLKTRLAHETKIGEKGELQNTLRIEKQHTWSEAAFKKTFQPLLDRYGLGKISLQTLKFILGAGPNRDYLRVYVPKGSRLTESTGFPLGDVTTTQDLGYTVFALYYPPVEAGKTRTVILKYDLPYRLSLQNGDTYAFRFHPQAGAENVELNQFLILSEGLEQISEYRTETSAAALIKAR